ncbi:MAG TPA: hypothetical protein VFD91_09255 [Mariniphaga sp.]|nr:hypothetical protein [Mariniphaga sp.]
MKKFVIAVFGILTMGFYACSDDDAERIEDPTEGEAVELTYNFEAGDEGWDAGIIGIPADEEEAHGFEVNHVTAPYDENTGALLLSASNPNNNLFIYTARHLTGLEPNTSYDISYSVQFASVVEIDTIGVDIDTTGVGSDTTGIVNDTIDIVGNANDTINIKVGAANEELVVEETASNLLNLVGIDVGDPGVDGADLVVIGSFVADSDDSDYTLHTASTENPVSIMTNDDGELWLIVGAETFGSTTEIYINNIEVTIEQ